MLTPTHTHTQTQIDDLLVYFPSIHSKQAFNVQKKKERDLQQEMQFDVSVPTQS